MISAFYLCWNYYQRSKRVTFKCDFGIASSYAHGGPRGDYAYKDWLLFLWRWIPWFNAWYVIGSLCTLYVVYRILRIKYGWIAVLPYCKIAGLTLGSGNITPILAALCLTIPGCLVAGLVKPYVLGIIPILAYCRLHARRVESHAERFADYIFRLFQNSRFYLYLHRRYNIL